MVAEADAASTTRTSMVAAAVVAGGVAAGDEDAEVGVGVEVGEASTTRTSECFRRISCPFSSPTP